MTLEKANEYVKEKYDNITITHSPTNGFSVVYCIKEGDTITHKAKIISGLFKGKINEAVKDLK